MTQYTGKAETVSVNVRENEVADYADSNEHYGKHLPGPFPPEMTRETE